SNRSPWLKPRSGVPESRSRRWPASARRTRSIRKGCNGAAAFCARCSARRALNAARAALEQRLEHGQHRLGIPFGGALDPPDYPALRVDDDSRRQPAHVEGVTHIGLRVWVDLELLKTS